LRLETSGSFVSFAEQVKATHCGLQAYRFKQCLGGRFVPASQVQGRSEPKPDSCRLREVPRCTVECGHGFIQSARVEKHRRIVDAVVLISRLEPGSIAEGLDRRGEIPRFLLDAAEQVRSCGPGGSAQK